MTDHAYPAAKNSARGLIPDFVRDTNVDTELGAAALNQEQPLCSLALGRLLEARSVRPCALSNGTTKLSYQIRVNCVETNSGLHKSAQGSIIGTRIRSEDAPLSHAVRIPNQSLQKINE